jgi:hypothetical protein
MHYPWEELEAYQRAQGVVVDTLDGRMQVLEAASTEALGEVRELSIRVEREMFLVREGLAETQK